MKLVPVFDYKHTQAQAPVVDAEKGLITGVHFCGIKSLNGYGYLPKALQEAVNRNLYNDIPIWDLHPSEEEMKTGDVRRGLLTKAGVTCNAQFREGSGVWGDVKVNMGAGDLAKSFLWNAANDPKNFGMSHEALVNEPVEQKGFEGHWTDHVEQVLALAVVPDPATTKGFFESQKTRRNWFVVDSQKKKETSEDEMKPITLEDVKKAGLYDKIVESVTKDMQATEAQKAEAARIKDLETRLKAAESQNLQAAFDKDMAQLIIDFKLEKAEVEFLSDSLKALDSFEKRKAKVESFRKLNAARTTSQNADTPPRDFFGESKKAEGGSELHSFAKKEMTVENRKAFAACLRGGTDLPQ